MSAYNEFPSTPKSLSTRGRRHAVSFKKPSAGRLPDLRGFEEGGTFHHRRTVRAALGSYNLQQIPFQTETARFPFNGIVIDFNAREVNLRVCRATTWTGVISLRSRIESASIGVCSGINRPPEVYRIDVASQSLDMDDLNQIFAETASSTWIYRTRPQHELDWAMNVESYPTSNRGCMKYLLDTNIITALIKGDPRVLAQLEAHRDDGVYLCQPIYYEAMRGLLWKQATAKIQTLQRLRLRWCSSSTDAVMPSSPPTLRTSRPSPAAMCTSCFRA